jgi:hypothetical protein
MSREQGRGAEERNEEQGIMNREQGRGATDRNEEQVIMNREQGRGAKDRNEEQGMKSREQGITKGWVATGPGLLNFYVLTFSVQAPSAA